MATTSSPAEIGPGLDRRRRRRELTIAEAGDLAEGIVEGAGGGARAIAVQRRQLGRRAAGDEAVRLFTVVISGLFTQQVANQPRVPYEAGVFTALTDQALEMFFDRYRPTRRS